MPMGVPKKNDPDLGGKVRKSGCESICVGAEYTEEEVEFLKAVASYRSRTGVKFLAAVDYLTVLKSIGYTCQPPANTLPAVPPTTPDTL